MAVLSQLSDFEVTIEVEDNPLPEYDFVGPLDEQHAKADATAAKDDASPSNVTYTGAERKAVCVTKYIEVPLSREFTIRYKCSPNFEHDSDRIYLEPSLDGRAVFIPDVRYVPMGGDYSHVCYGGEVWHGDTMRSHRFKFTELDTVTPAACYYETATLVPSTVEGQMTEAMRRQMRDHGDIRLDFYFTQKGHTVAVTELAQSQSDEISKCQSDLGISQCQISFPSLFL